MPSFDNIDQLVLVIIAFNLCNQGCFGVWLFRCCFCLFVKISRLIGKEQNRNFVNQHQTVHIKSLKGSFYNETDYFSYSYEQENISLFLGDLITQVVVSNRGHN